MDGIERIEVALRTALTYEGAHRHGAFGYANPACFDPRFAHAALMDEIRDAEARSRESFVAHYRAKYRTEKFLPIWMASELLSFGWLSRLYAGSDPHTKRKIAGRFRVHDPVFVSWLHSLSYVRNVCAHHSRLWNRELAVRPALPRSSAAWPYAICGPNRLYCILLIIRHCLLQISPGCHWHHRLLQLFDSHPEVDLSAMQCPAEWRRTAPWVAVGS